MKGLKFFVVAMTSPTASLPAATTGSWPANGSETTGSLRNSSCQATVSAASHFPAVTATPVLGLYPPVRTEGTAAAPPLLLAPPLDAGAGVPEPEPVPAPVAVASDMIGVSTF